MNLIDVTYFEVEPLIAQLNQQEVIERVQLFIARYEPRFLRQLLGNGLAKAFIEGLEPEEPAQRWLDLRDGKEYEDTAGNVFEWPGLASDETKISAIANYVYYWYTRDNASWSTGSGDVVPSVENGERVGPAAKQAQVWSDMIRLNYQCIHFLRTNKDTYPEWKGFNWSYADFAYFRAWFSPFVTDHCFWWPNRLVRPDIFTPINAMNL